MVTRPCREGPLPTTALKQCAFALLDIVSLRFGKIDDGMMQYS
jgi:hypothetical protein